MVFSRIVFSVLEFFFLFIVFISIFSFIEAIFLYVFKPGCSSFEIIVW